MITIANGFCFFNKREIGSVLRFQRYFGVKANSYAGTIARRLYYQYFGDSHSLHRYYKKYYQKEFSSCAEFLECRLMINHDLAGKIQKDYSDFASFRNKSDDVRYSMNFDEELVSLFHEYVGGIYNESSNRICY